MTRPFSNALRCLQNSGLRPTRQRLVLAKLLFDGDDRHVTAETLHQEVSKLGDRVSLATVYNTLHQFKQVNLLKEVVIDSGCTYFDTNVSEHHHLFFKEEKYLQDIDKSDLKISALPQVPEGKTISSISVVVHIKNSDD
jgi:Fur family transcriptional regulator, iron response regulator